MNYKIAIVVFDQGYETPTVKQYNYKSHVLDIQKDDMAVVEVGEKYKVVRVIDVLDNTFENAKEANKATNFIVCKVDMKAYAEAKEMEAKREWILKQLEERKKAVQEIQIYKMLAESDPEAKQLLLELEKMDK